MKILQVNKFNYVRGGAEKYFIEISKSLEKVGQEVAIFSMHHPKNLPSLWSKYFVSRISFNEPTILNRIITPGRILYSLEAKRKFKKLIKDFKPDIIHIHNIYHQISPSILSVARKNNIPVVMHLHDYKLICPNYQLFVDGQICYRCKGGKYGNCIKYRCFKKSLLASILATVEMWFHHKILKIYKKSVSHFIAPSKFMKNTLVDFSWPENKIDVLYNFSDKLENNLSINELGDYGLYFGRLSVEKGLDVLLRAMSLADKKIKLKIVGSGPEEKNLKKMVQDLGLEQQVEFLGYKNFVELSEIIKKAKIIFLPSVWCENMPLTLIESMMLKKVVVASNTGGLPELIKDQESGFLFKNGDVSDLSRVINLLDNYDLEKISNQAYSLVKDLNIDNHLVKLIDIYNRVLFDKKITRNRRDE